jgi:hypothetical protein
MIADLNPAVTGGISLFIHFYVATVITSVNILTPLPSSVRGVSLGLSDNLKVSKWHLYWL